MKLSIITLTYNHLKYTKKIIESLYKYTSDFELIIVDNGSTDGTGEYLKSLNYDNLKIIFNTENLGFSRGNNQGIEIAEGEYIGFLNNDILLYPNWFEECEKVFQKENAAFVSPRHINPYYDNTNENNYIKYFQKNFKYNSQYEKNFDECVFSCVLTKRSVINNIGFFDENYSPAFFEDNDIKYRAILKGYGIYVVNNICFYHFGSITSIKHNKNFEKNKQYFYDKYLFGEYLSISGMEINILRHKIKFIRSFPINIFYKFYVFKDKILNRIKRGIIKH